MLALQMHSVADSALYFLFGKLFVLSLCLSLFLSVPFFSTFLLLASAWTAVAGVAASINFKLFVFAASYKFLSSLFIQTVDATDIRDEGNSQRKRTFLFSSFFFPRRSIRTSARMNSILQVSLLFISICMKEYREATNLCLLVCLRTDSECTPK